MFRSITVANAAQEQQDFFLADELSFEILRHLSLDELRLILLVCRGAADTMKRVIASYSFPAFAHNVFTMFTSQPITPSFQSYLARENVTRSLLAKPDDNTGWKSLMSVLFQTETPAPPNTVRNIVRCILLNPRFACRMIAELKAQGTNEKLLFQTLGQNQPTCWLRIFNFLTSDAPKAELIADLKHALEDIVDDVPFHTALKDSINLTLKMIAGSMDEVLTQLTPHRTFFANLSGGQFSYKDLTKKNLSGLKLTDADFQYCIAPHCDFSFSDCSGGSFYKSDCPDAFFVHTILRGTNFSCVNLFRANCQSVDLRRTPEGKKTQTLMSIFSFTNLTHALIDEINLVGFTIKNNIICHIPSVMSWGIYSEEINFESVAQSATLFILHYRANQLGKIKKRDGAQDFELKVIIDLITEINENASLSHSFSDVFDACLAKHHMRVKPTPRLEQITTETHSIFTLISCLVAETKLMMKKHQPKETLSAGKLTASM